MTGIIRWLSKPFITPIDCFIIFGAGALTDHLGWWSMLIALPLFIGSAAVERRFWLIRERSRP